MSWIHKLQQEWSERHSQESFTWHASLFFPPLESSFSPFERNNIAHFIQAISAIQSKRIGPFPFEKRQFFLHHINGDHVNSSQFAFALHPMSETFFQAARSLMSYHNIVLPNYLREHLSTHLYGLGWDLLQKKRHVFFSIPCLDHFTMHAFVENMKAIRNTIHPQAILRLTFIDGNLEEEMICLFLKIPDKGEFFPRTQRKKLFFSTTKNDISYVESMDSIYWRQKLNLHGQKIFECYDYRSDKHPSIWLRTEDHVLLVYT